MNSVSKTIQQSYAIGHMGHNVLQRNILIETECGPRPPECVEAMAQRGYGQCLRICFNASLIWVSIIWL